MPVYAKDGLVIRQRPPSLTMKFSLGRLWQELAQRAGDGAGRSRPAVFFDRDGTINAERGYLRHPTEVCLLPTAGEALRALNGLAIPVVVVTNQSGLGRGLIAWDEFERVNAALWQALQAERAHYNALYYCPHVPDRGSPCACRKPQPGLLLQAAFDLGLDLRQCFMVGDKRSDLQAGRAAGCQTVLVRTGHGEATFREATLEGDQPGCIAATLQEAARWIISQPVSWHDAPI